MFTPYDWQTEDLRTLRDNDYTALVAIETGGGKTALACMAIKESDPDVVLIVAPDSTLRWPNKGWPKAVKEIAGREPRKIGRVLKAHREAMFDFEWGTPGVYMCSTQFFARKSTRTEVWRGDMLIVDEIHKLATARKEGQRALSGYSQRDRPISQRFRHRLALSGTPMRQNFQNMWATMRFLWPELWRKHEVAHENFYTWCEDRMDYEEVVTDFKWIPILPDTQVPPKARTKWIDGVKHYGQPETVKNWKTETEPGRLITEAPCVVQHKRRERCCEYHPRGFLETEEPEVIERVVELTAKQKKAIRDLEDHYMTWLDDNPLVTNLSITQKQRIRQMTLGEPWVEYWNDDEGNEHATIHFEKDCASPFVTELLSILSEDVPDEPVVVFLESQQFAEVVVHRLTKAGISAQEYSGKRKADLGGFGTEYRILVAVVASIGTGTDGLQDVCNTEVWMEVPVSLTDEHQGQARLDRMGGRKVLRFRIMDSEGVAQGRLRSNLEKALMIRKSMRKVT